jgi:hypothetical protein
MMFEDLTKTDHKKLVALENIIEVGLRTFSDVGNALLQIRDEQLYRPQYNSFEDYCEEKRDMDHSHACRLMHSAQVIENLKSSPIGELLPQNEAQARPLALLPPEQQSEAWNKAVRSAPEGKTPSAGLVQRIVDRIRAKTGQEKRMIKASEGWSKEDLAKDEELKDAFTAIEAIYGKDDAKAIQSGIVQLKRADILYLAKLPKEKMKEIQDLIFANRWTPQHAVKFLSKMPTEKDPIEHLINLCLGTKGKFWQGDFGGGAFTVTCKANWAIR